MQIAGVKPFQLLDLKSRQVWELWSICSARLRKPTFPRSSDSCWRCWKEPILPDKCLGTESPSFCFFCFFAKYVYVSTCACMYLEVRGQWATSDVCQVCAVYWFLAWSYPSSWSWMASKPQESACFCLPSSGIVNIKHPIHLAHSPKPMMIHLFVSTRITVSNAVHSLETVL